MPLLTEFGGNGVVENYKHATPTAFGMVGPLGSGPWSDIAQKRAS